MGLLTKCLLHVSFDSVFLEGKIFYMDDKYPDKAGARYTKSVTLRIEQELYDIFEVLRKSSTKDISECQRIAWRKLADELLSCKETKPAA